MEEGNNKKQRNTLLMVISILTFVTLSVMLVGMTFANFTGKISGPDEVTTLIKSANIMLVYEQSNEINEINIFPGWEKALLFSIENQTTEDSIAKYEITLEVFEALTDTPVNDFVYELTSSSNVTGGKTDVLVSKTQTNIPVTDTSLGVATISAGVKHSYELKLKFIETGGDQNEYAGKTFKAKVKVVRVPGI